MIWSKAWPASHFSPSPPDHPKPHTHAVLIIEFLLLLLLLIIIGRKWHSLYSICGCVVFFSSLGESSLSDESYVPGSFHFSQVDRLQGLAQKYSAAYTALLPFTTSS